MLVIESFSERRRAEWDAFVHSRPEATFFHLAGWKDAVERAYGHTAHYLLAADDGVLRGVLPLFELKSRLFGHSLVSVPFGVYGGVLAADAEAEAALLDAAHSLGSMLGVDYLELRQLPVVAATFHGEGGKVPEAELPPLPAGWQRKDLHVTYVKAILPDAEANMKAIPRKQRAMVRKGIAAGLTSVVGREAELERFYPIYARNVRDLGTPVFPKKFFAECLRMFPESFVLTVLSGDKPVAGVLSFVFRDWLMPYYGAGLREHFHEAVNDFMYWELLRHGCEHGFKVFDFGRSKKGSGSGRFKEHWGFEATPLDYRVRLERAQAMPEVNPNNPKYKYFIETWKRLPLPVANLLGPQIVKYIP